jgi:protein involved in polysaccharide export with SLBB domain
MNIPFSDIALTNGSVIEVEQINPQVFTVIGLVRRAGAFPYPPNARYTLLDALGFAGGVDEIIDPRFVRIYRRTADGRIVDSAFELKGFLPTSAAAMFIKPGDVIAVEQTPRTRTNLILSQIFRMQFGGYYNFSANN